MEETVKILIKNNSISWLARKLDVDRATVYSRIKKGNWKKLEKKEIMELAEKHRREAINILAENL